MCELPIAVASQKANHAAVETTPAGTKILLQSIHKVHKHFLYMPKAPDFTHE